MLQVLRKGIQYKSEVTTKPLLVRGVPTSRIISSVIAASDRNDLVGPKTTIKDVQSYRRTHGLKNELESCNLEKAKLKVKMIGIYKVRT